MSVIPAPFARVRRASLTCTMAALCAGAFAGEAGGQPGETPKPGIDPQLMEKLAQEAAAWRSGPAALAAYHFDQGMKARDENRLDDAVRSFAAAVDQAPEDARYRKALDEARALAGVPRDPRGTAIDQVADEVEQLGVHETPGVAGGPVREDAY